MKRENARGFYLGQVRFSGIGGYQEKMLSQLLEMGIALRGVRVKGGVIKGTVSPMDYYTVAETARKNGVKLRAGKRRGLYFTLMRYQRRVGLYVGALLFGIILSVNQSRIAEIHIEGNAPRGQVLKILEDCGITEGADRMGLKTYKAERELMLAIENCAWADVSCTGCRVTVHLETGVPLPDMEDNSAPRNLVASRDAVVVSRTVRRGASVVEVGSGVQEGGLLVSGVVETSSIVLNGSETGNVLFVRADAEIIGEFTETLEFFVPYNETLHIPDGEQTRYKSLVFEDDIYPLYFGRAYKENAVYSEETAIVSIFGAEMPFKIKTGIYTEYRDADITRTDDDCVKELRRLKSDYEANFYKDFDIINVTEKFLPEKEGIRLILDYTLQGNIAVPADFEINVKDTQSIQPIQPVQPAESSSPAESSEAG